MAYKDLHDFIEKLKSDNELITISEFVDPVLEIAEITDRFSKSEGGGRALLFTNTGTEFPVLTNAMGSDYRMALSLGVADLKGIENRMEKLFGDITEPRAGFIEKLSLLPTLSRIAGYFPVSRKGKASCQEVIHSNPDLSILPILQTWPYDGGRFITLPLVFTHDPETGNRNVGMYRMQVFDRKTTGMHWHRHKTGANHYEKYKKLGKIMPVAVALGGDPAIIYSATAPLPENIDELLLAGFLRAKAVQMVKCLTQDIEVPADAEIIIEGYVDPSEEKRIEGPFGDHTGFYSLEDEYPVFHVTCITHRKNAVYPATLVGIPPQEDAWIAKATEHIFITPIRKAIVPELENMFIPEFGVAHNLTMVSINKSFPGQAKKVMNALWGAGQMMFNKVLIVCDREVDIYNLSEVLELLKKADPDKCLSIISGPLDVLDHASTHTGFGSKLGIDLTTAFLEEKPPGETEIIKRKHKGSPDFNILKEVKEFRIIYEGNYPTFALLAIEKKQGYNLSTFIHKLQQINDIEIFSAILIVDEYINIHLFKEFLWYFLNNLEPQRDILRIKLNSNETVVVIDGTAKNFENDGFLRDWPNPVVMDEITVKTLTLKWKELNLGSLLSSPSDHYRKLVRNKGARAFKNA